MLAARASRALLAVSLLALAAAAVDVPHQRSPLLLLVPAALFLAGALARPALGVLAAAFLVPLLPVAGNLVPGPWVAPAELLLLALAAALLLRPPRIPVPADPSGLLPTLGISVAALSAGAIAATAAALAPAELPGALGHLGRTFFSPGVAHAALPLRTALVHAAGLLGFLAFRRAAAEKGAESLLGAVVAGLAGVGLYAGVEAATGLKLWPAVLYELFSHGMRVPATLPDYNATGAVLALGLFPAVALARRARGAARAGWGAAAALLLAGLLLSGSRGAWLAALAALAVALAAGLRSRASRDGDRRRTLLAAGLVVLLATVAVAAWPGAVGQLLRKRVATLLHPAEAVRSVRAGRLGFWIAGARMVKDHPLAGVGPGRVPARFADYRPDELDVDEENIHDYFLQALAEDGLPGGTLVLLPFLPLGLLVVRALARGDVLGSPLLALAPGLLAFGLTGLSAHPWLLPELQLLFWGCAALLAPAAGAAPAAERSRRFRRAAVPGLLLALAAWAVPRLATAPGTERGRFGFASWETRRDESRFFWTGPSALVPVTVPAQRAVVRLRTLVPEAEYYPVHATVRLDGGPASSLSLRDEEWHDVEVERGSLGPGQTVEAGSGLLRVDASRGFCPARDGGKDRRLLALQLARPPLRPAPEARP